VEYSGEGFRSADQYTDIEDLWEDHDDAELILIDVPIGLREEDNSLRPCDAEARDRLGAPRGSSVFPVPVRGVLEAENYEDAKQMQEELTDGSLGAQTWGNLG